LRPPVHGYADIPEPARTEPRVPATPAAPAWLYAPERKEAEKIGQLAGGLAQCMKALPRFATAQGETVRAWMARNAADIRRAEADPYFGDSIRKGLEYVPRLQTDSDRGMFEMQCDALAVGVLGKMIPVAGFETPESTVRQLTNAMLAGRIDDALRSVSPDSRERLRKLFAAQRPERLQRLLRAMSDLDSVSVIGDVVNGQIASARYHLDGRGGEIHFIRYFDRWYVTEVM